MHWRGLAVRVYAATVLAALAAAAQDISFVVQPDSLVATGNFCCAIVAGDFNGDGKPDLVVGGGPSGLTLLLNNGAGGFTARSIATSVANSTVLAIADFDKDGKLDLVIVGDAGTYLLFGNGDGTFRQSSSPISSMSGAVVLVADFNHDGNPDLLFSTGSSFYVRLGKGDGTFQQPSATQSSMATNFFAYAVAGDVNGDGILDVIQSSAYHDGVVGIWLGNGDGTFREARYLSTRDYYGRKPVAIGDFNSDGKLDVAVALGVLSPFAGLAPPAVQIFFGHGDGTFRPGPIVPSVATGGLVAADFNGDGKLDLASGPAIFLGNGDGTFQFAAYFIDNHPDTSPLIAVDLNGDGRPDLVRTNTSAFSLLLNNSPGNPGSVTAVPSTGIATSIAPDSLASIYGSHLSTQQPATASGMWPTELGGIRLRVRDSARTERLAQLLYVSPTLINFLVPSGTAIGWATLTIDSGEAFQEGTKATMVTAAAPGFFTVDGQPNGVAAATALRVLSDGSVQNVTVFSCSGPSTCTAVPIDLSIGAVYLSLYGTGLRNASHTDCFISTDALQTGLPVTYSGPQPTIPGLDQVNILLKPPIASSGTQSILCRFDGVIDANVVQIRIK
jgi:uncharacterized protein (TIGR03437 family)